MQIATTQVSVDTTLGGKLLVAERAGRVKVTLVNHGTTDVFVGAAGLTTGTGALLKGAAGQTLTLDGAMPVYGIVAASTQTISVIETF
jgi:hypothetical protein